MPLHVHSRFSLLDSLIDVTALAKRASELGMPAVAVTDHGALYGLVYHYKACRKAGVKPILGMELYVRKNLEDKGENSHLILLARNSRGYQNLVKLATEAALGATKRAIADHAMLERYGEGLIATSACIQGAIPRALLAGNPEQALSLVDFYARVFDGFYLELQANSIPEQATVNRALVDIARAKGIPLSASSDAHYLNWDDAAAHDVLLAVQTHKLVEDTNRLRFSVPDFWLMNEDEMRTYLSMAGVDDDAAAEALDNTVRIAEECDVVLNLGNPQMPVYSPTPTEIERYGDIPAHKMLRAMAYDALSASPFANDPTYRERLDEELAVICDAGFAGYFLIVQDIIGWAKANGIMVGPGRGSIGGCLLALLLGITEVDPIKHRLFFERFLNRERAMSDYDWVFEGSPPREGDSYGDPGEIEFVQELDTDEFVEATWEYEQMERQGLSGYYTRLVQEQFFSEDNGPQSWLAYGMGLAGKPCTLDRTRLHVIRQGSQPDIDIDIADDERQRVLEYVVDRYGHDRVAQIGNITTMGARDALKRVAKAMGWSPSEADRLSALVPKAPDITLEKALAETPELLQAREEHPEIFEYAMKIEGCAATTSIHAAGIAIAPCDITDVVPLHKGAGGEIVTQYDMDAVGDLVLKIDLLGLRTLSVIKRAMDLAHKDVSLLRRVSLDDPEVYEMLARGDTDGVFQVSSSLFRGLLRDVVPTCFEDLVAVLSLGRPGPGSMAEMYVQRRNGIEPVVYPDPRLESILADTYGTMLYQEQVMQIARDLAGYTMGQADILRKAMGKKSPEVMAQEHDRFVEGCIRNGLREQAAEELFAQIAEFAGYGFNRAHSLEYAIITYWTALLKLYYPAEFLTACLTDKAESTGTTRHSLMSGFMNQARARGIQVLLPDINRSERGFSIETLDDGEKVIRIGLSAIDGLGDRAIDHILDKRPFESVEDMLERCQAQLVSVARARNLIYAGAFDWQDENRFRLYRRYLEKKLEIKKDKKVAELLESIPSEFGRKDRIKCEKDVLGYTISDIGRFAAAPIGGSVELTGRVEGVLVKRDKYDREMAFFTLDTDEGESVRVVVFAKTYRQKRKLVKDGNALTVFGVKQEYSVVAEDIEGCAIEA